MNSEELELSLRTEFETYLKGLTDDMRREVAEFQAKIESEVEKHKSQLDTAFREFSDRLGSEKEFDGAFSESVVEHLRLARDEGAQLAANAFAEAEDLRRSSSSAASDDGGFGKLRNAIADISSQSSQATILRSLVEHAAQFTSRGAFFIVKNDNFVGWKVFGSNAFAGDETVRSVEFPVGTPSLLASAVDSLQSVSGSSADASENTMFLGPLGFGDPVSMHAIPLIARGRGVAVLYADSTGDDAPTNVEALEALVGVAGLRVELLASSQTVPATAVQESAGAENSYDRQPETAVEEPAVEETSYAAEPETGTEVENVYEVEPETHYGDAQVIEEEHSASFESEEEVTYEEAETEAAEEFVEEVSETESGFEFAPSEAAEVQAEAQDDAGSFETVEHAGAEPEAEAPAEIPYVGETTSDYSFTSSETSGSSAFDEPAEEAKPAFEPAAAVSEPVVETVGSQPRRPRLSRRNVDLPIEVTEEERPMHNDARLFARLLVSEIKLYNQQKVNEGRETGDLYDRLREAIDRSREMYEKRVHAPVAQKFDYFHYELVNSLSEGKPELLGSSYPGATV